MPKSRSRRRREFTPPKESASTAGSGGRWVVPTMLTLLISGLLWIVVYYIAGNEVPVMADLGGYNLLIGMGLITGGFMVATQWK